MKSGITKLTMATMIAILLVAAGSTAAWAQAPACSTTPSYPTDFSANQNCLTVNGTTQGYPGFYAPVAPAPAGVSNVLRLTPNVDFTAGTAWYNTQQPVANAFSTTFTFQLSGANSVSCGNIPCPEDGIAFVIQNSGTNALGPEGCGVGFGTSQFCLPNTGTHDGIPNSLAIEFKTFQDSPNDPSNNYVAIQNCSPAGAPTGPNSVDPACQIAINPNVLPTLMADGNVHTVTINYSGAPSNLLDVILDGTDLFPGGVVFDLTTIGLNSGNAWVGFTAATGGGDDNQDILSWTFSPGSQSEVITPQAPALFNFEGGFQPGGYNYNAQLTQGPPVLGQVTPIVLPNQTSCNTIVQASFPGAQCFVYQNANGPNTPSAPVMFELTCPQSPGGTCGSEQLQNFLADLGTDFNFALAENAGFNQSNPHPGWLKGVGSDPLHPCSQNPNNNPPLFQSNQIESFFVDGDPGGHAKGSSAGTGSCWLLTYNTPNEAPSVNIVSPANGGTYQLGQATQANYTCTTVNNVPNVTGPYLTKSSCSAVDSPGGAVAPGAQFDTTTLGTHTFTATVFDSATNNASQTVTYTVVGSTDLAILNVAPSKAATGSRLTYGIGVGDLGNANAVNVVVNDTLAPGTSFLSASGTNVACSIVKGKLSCATLNVPCSFSGGKVSCSVGSLMPLSLFALNGAVIQVTVQVTAQPGTQKNPTVLSNTATVSASNADSKLGNNTSTANTTVTAK
jgi:uncharacterized repeat protein (TIGR01451 family)